MKKTLSTSDIAHALKSDEYAAWSWNGARALAEYLEQLEEDTGEEMELDRCAIRCDFSEHETALEVARDHGNDWTPEMFNDDGTENEEFEEELEEHCLEWLRDRTTVIEFDGGVIVSCF
jgi:hypothetical protein